MTKRAGNIATAVVLAVVLAGCGGGGGDDRATPPPSTTTTTAGQAPTTQRPTTTPTTEDPATLRSYVAQLAPAIASWRESYDDYPGCLIGGCSPMAGMEILGLTFVSETIFMTSQTAERDNPPPPADVAEMLTDLRAAASAIDDAHQAWTDGDCAIPAADPCQPLLREVEWAFGAMDDAVVRWESLG